MNILNEKCVPCEGGLGKMNPQEAELLLKNAPEWSITENYTRLFREFKFKNFKQAQAFVNKVSDIAETEDHHPDIEFGWGYARIIIFTHAVGGLHENDFILASKISKLCA